MKIIDEKKDSIELLQGALQVLNHSGFQTKSRLFWTQMNSAPSMVKEEKSLRRTVSSS